MLDRHDETSRREDILGERDILDVAVIVMQVSQLRNRPRPQPNDGLFFSVPCPLNRRVPQLRMEGPLGLSGISICACRPLLRPQKSETLRSQGSMTFCWSYCEYQEGKERGWDENGEEPKPKWFGTHKLVVTVGRPQRTSRVIKIKPQIARKPRQSSQSCSES